MRQLGIDRIIDLAFGSGEAAYHVILELYDRVGFLFRNTVKIKIPHFSLKKIMSTPKIQWEDGFTGYPSFCPSLINDWLYIGKV